MKNKEMEENVFTHDYTTYIPRKTKRWKKGKKKQTTHLGIGRNHKTLRYLLMSYLTDVTVILVKNWSVLFLGVIKGRNIKSVLASGVWDLQPVQ